MIIRHVLCRIRYPTSSLLIQQRFSTRAGLFKQTKDLDKLLSQLDLGSDVTDADLTKQINDLNYKSQIFNSEDDFQDSLFDQKPIDPSRIANMDDYLGDPNDRVHTARDHPKTVIGRVEAEVLQIPDFFAPVISPTTSRMKSIRPQVQHLYSRKITENRDKDFLPRSNEVDAYLAAFFPQNYANAYYALSEARRRLGPTWRPNRVLDIGNGPATGLLAMNEIFRDSDSWKPERFSSSIYSDPVMMRRAQLLLELQMADVQSGDDHEIWKELADENENQPETVESLQAKLAVLEQPREEDLPGSLKQKNEQEEYDSELFDEQELAQLRSYRQKIEQENEQVDDQVMQEELEKLTDDYKKTKYDLIVEQIWTRFEKRRRQKKRSDDDRNTRYDGVKFRINKLPSLDGKKYDLIIMQDRLLLKSERTKGASDVRIKNILHLLAPGGVLVLVERGNPVGFERIARARHVILRPKGKLQSRLDYDELDLQAAAARARAKNNDDEQHKSSKQFTVAIRSHNDKFLQDLGVVEEEFDIDSKLTDGLRIIAPCPHQNHCPMMLGVVIDKAQFTAAQQKLRQRQQDEESDEQDQADSGSDKIPRRDTWCHFPQKMQRPRWLMELKSGRLLSSRWGSQGQKLGKHGRHGNKSVETSKLSYLIVQKQNSSDNRDHDQANLPTDEVLRESISWPRLTAPPMKRDHHIIMDVCSSIGYLERWSISKSYGGEQVARDARKSKWGDLWPHGAKHMQTRSVLRNQSPREIPKHDDSSQRKKYKYGRTVDQPVKRQIEDPEHEILSPDEEFWKKHYNI
ncbi:hypothetical protein V1514DRAFT_332822 [Lipomyces japonicus]|uniref:uncharacterized protein n=1 Tax=Lipomyces japonicus TaxID=56871 RepID=UPI0034CDB09E